MKNVSANSESKSMRLLIKEWDLVLIQNEQYSFHCFIFFISVVRNSF